MFAFLRPGRGASDVTSRASSTVVLRRTLIIVPYCHRSRQRQLYPLAPLHDLPTAPTAPTVADQNQLDKLLNNPDKEIRLPTATKERTLRAPVEMMKSVQGSSSGAGSGEFHVYKQSRRREYERIKLMEDKARAVSGDVGTDLHGFGLCSHNSSIGALESHFVTNLRPAYALPTPTPWLAWFPSLRAMLMLVHSVPTTFARL
jgi:hypothetical protein